MISRVDTGKFPKLALPLPIPYAPMEARRAKELPSGGGWQFEPKWDGFRCLVFRDKNAVILQSKAGQPLTRYFPELVAALHSLDGLAFVLDGEIVVPVDGMPSFDDLLLRIHPAESRIAKLAKHIPAKLLVFDLLYESINGGHLLVNQPLSARRKHLERFFRTVPTPSLIQLSPATTDRHVATGWLQSADAMGLDGVIAKRMEEPYHAGDRDAMVKIKNVRTADCVVGGVRYSADHQIGSLLLGLYDHTGLLNLVGHTSSFTETLSKELPKIIEPLKGGPGFSGKAPGGPSRWSQKRNMDWEPLNPQLVCEVRYDHFSQNRFRHGTVFLRWRPDKDPKTCTVDQVALDNDRRGVS